MDENKKRTDIFSVQRTFGNVESDIFILSQFSTVDIAQCNHNDTVVGQSYTEHSVDKCQNGICRPIEGDI